MKEVRLVGKTPIAGIDSVDPETQIDAAARVQTPLIYCVLSPTTIYIM